MRKIIRFSKFFVPAAVISCVLAAAGITGFIINKGFTLGVDFQAGLIQEVKFAPTAFKITWSGTTRAALSHNSGNIFIIISGSGIESRTFTFPFAEYATIGSLSQAMMQQLEGLNISLSAPSNVSSHWLMFSTQGDPNLGDESPYTVHYLQPDSKIIDISEVRAAMVSLGQSASVQSMGLPADRHFMVRVQDKDEGRIKPEEVTRYLEAYFGAGEVVVLRSDYVDSRLSNILTRQAPLWISLALLSILFYSAVRFKFQYAVALVIGIMYDALVVIGFVTWTRMEFTASTIAAILTIIGYSTNNTIVVFDRVRENLRMYSDESFLDILNRSLTETLNRTIITTVSTLIAVVMLFVFTTGSMKDFALALMVGMLSGVYTTTFIASGIVNFWERKKVEREKNKLMSSSSAAAG
jgi:preprotein translocase subunit SecF